VDLGRVKDLESAAIQLEELCEPQDDLLVHVNDCEHLAGELAGLLASWTSAQRGARFLISSREILGIRAEQTLELAGLSLPESELLLFDRARLKQVSTAERTAIRALVTELEGNPLEIELAATALDVLGPVDLLARLPKRLDALRPRRHTKGDRHESLRHAIELSWRLLTPEERETLVACSQFEGSFSLAAAEAVVDNPAAVASLRRKSMLRGGSAPETPGRQRLSLGSTLRAFAKEQGTPDPARYVAFWGSVAHEALGPQAEGSYARDRALALETANLKRAHALAAKSAPDTALAIAIALEPVVETYGELLKLLDDALAMAEKAEPLLVARARIVRAATCQLTDPASMALGQNELEAALAVTRERGDRLAEARALATLAHARATVDPQSSFMGFAEACAGLRECGDSRREAVALFYFAQALAADGKVKEARTRFDEAASVAERCGDVVTQCRIRTALGRLLYDMGRLDEAEAECSSALSEGALRSERAEAEARSALAPILQERGRFEEAEAHYRRAHDLFAKIDVCSSLAKVGIGIAKLHHERGDYETACRWYERSRNDREARTSYGAALAALDRLEAAEEVLEEAVDWGAAVLHRAQLDVARARRAEDRAIATACRIRVERTLASVSIASANGDERFAWRLLSSAAECAGWNHRGEDELVIGPEARWLILPDGKHIHLEYQRAHRRIILALAEAPPDGIPPDTLLERGWPGDEVDPSAGNARVRVALSRLRSLGLRACIVNRSNGYALRPGLKVTIEK
jgi:tetratricopeptide (TPR) repeat protein